MSQGQGLTQEQLSILLKAASARMGKDPEELKKELSIIGADQEKLRAMMENRAAMEELLKSAKVQGLLRELLGGK